MGILCQTSVLGLMCLSRLIETMAERPASLLVSNQVNKAATSKPYEYKAHFMNQGKKRKMVRRGSKLIESVCFPYPGSLYELSVYAHFTFDVKLPTYQNAVKGGCAALHTVAKAAHKLGMAHLYHAVEALERRCKLLERTANSQL